MEILPRNIRHIDGAKWLVKLRWLFIIWLLMATFGASYIFRFNIETTTLYSIAGGLVIENIFSYLLLRNVNHNKIRNLRKVVSRIINFQIAADLLFLIIILHYSGGIENPLFLFFTFHMVISSILLSKAESYFQTTFALLLIWGLSLLEYFSIINHHNLWLNRTAKNSLYNDLTYILETLIIFTLTSYFLVYMANYIVAQFRNQVKQYNKANFLLRQQDKIKDEYIQRVTHNIKGHLAVIQMNMSILKDESICPADKRGELINSSYERSSRLTTFVRELLKLTKMRLAEKDDNERFSIRDMMDYLIPSVEVDAELKEINFKYHIDEGIDLITGNPVSIEELIMNLLQNAILYTPDKGKIDFHIKDSKDFITLTIADTGIGIPQKELPYIFDEFYRASNASKMERGGSGLGLAMVKYITERHGGNIKVDSKEGSGTKFTINIPKDPSNSKKGKIFIQL